MQTDFKCRILYLMVLPPVHVLQEVCPVRPPVEYSLEHGRQSASVATSSVHSGEYESTGHTVQEVPSP